MRRNTAAVIGGIAGLIMIAEYFLVAPWVKTTGNVLKSWAVIISAFAVFLAAANLLVLHLGKISSRKAGFDESIVLTIAVVVTTLGGILGGKKSAVFTFMFDAIMEPVGSTIFALSIFWIISASYRVLRATNSRAVAMLLAAGLVMLGRAPVSETIWSKLPAIADWLMGPPTVAGQRAVMIAAAVGALSVGLRVLLGLERGHIGSSE